MQWIVRAAFCFWFLAGSSAAMDAEPDPSYRERRHALAAKRSDGAIVLFGYREGEGQAGHEPFRQENNFYYLTGWDEANAAIVLTPATARQTYRETLFLPPPSAGDAEWKGPQIDPLGPEAAARTGFEQVESLDKLRRAIRRAGRRFGRIYTALPAARPLERRRLIPDRRETIRELAPEVQITDLLPDIAKLRMVKSPAEIRLIEQAVHASVAAHLAAWKRVQPGLREYQVLAAMSAALIDRGCLRMAYPPIVGSGPNSVVLHYWRNRSRLQSGELLLMDVGGEFAHYAADLTRTVPVNGRFSDRQRSLYRTVLGAQQAALAAVKPGMTLDGRSANSLTEIVRRYFEEAEPGLSGRFLHGVGHYIGLDVHDPGSTFAPLEPGMALTIEPGLYFPDEALGIRIEDVVVVTETGMRNLSAALPKDPDAIERLMAAQSEVAVER